MGCSYWSKLDKAPRDQDGWPIMKGDNVENKRKQVASTPPHPVLPLVPPYYRRVDQYAHLRGAMNELQKLFPHAAVDVCDDDEGEFIIVCESPEDGAQPKPGLVQGPTPTVHRLLRPKVVCWWPFNGSKRVSECSFDGSRFAATSQKILMTVVNSRKKTGKSG